MDATGEETKVPTATEAGEMTYTSAAFENKAFTIQTKKVKIAKLAYTVGWYKSADGK